MTGHPIPDVALAHHSAILGKTGSGKTSTAKTIVEHLVALGHRVCILDPIKSDWWGLTAASDGAAPGLPFAILGGPHADVEIEASTGAVVGEAVATGALPLSIIDMALFKPGGQARFFSEFAPALLKHAQGVVYLVLEEAHLFAPKERGGLGDENLAIHYAKLLATAGRSKGIKLILATQRTQSLHNALLGSCETMIAHRLTAPADQKPLIDWLKANAEREVVDGVAASLSSLPTGTGWVISGEARIFEQVVFPPIATFDNSATPKAGEVRPDHIERAKPDLRALEALVAPAASETGPAAGKPQAGALEAAEQRGYHRGWELGLVEGEARGRTAGIAVGLSRAQEAVNALRVPEILAKDFAEPAPSRSNTTPPAQGPTRSPRTPSAPRATGALPSSSYKLLSVMNAAPRPVTWPEAAVLAILAPTGGSFNSAKKALVDGGHVAQAGDGVLLPSSQQPAPPLVASHIVEAWASKLGGSAARILRHLCDSDRQTKADIAAALSLAPTGGSWNSAWKQLRVNGLIEEDAGAYRLASILRELSR